MPHPPDRTELDLLALFAVLVKRRRTVLVACLASAVIATGYSLWLPNQYSATARVLPPQREGGALNSVLGQMGGAAALAAGAKGTDSELYLTILRSRSVESAVSERLKLSGIYRTRTVNETLRELDKAFTAQTGKDGVICITTRAEDPTLAARLANTLVDELGRTLVRLNLSKAGSERLFLEQRLDVVRKELRAAEDDLKSFAQKNRIVQVETQATAAVGNVGRLKAELASKEVQLAVLRRSQTDQSFEVKALQEAVTRLKAELGRSAGSGGGEEGIPAIARVPGLGLEYTRRLRELKTQEALYEQLTKQYELAKLNEAKDSSSLQVLDEATVPDVKSGPMRLSIVALTTVIAFIASLALVFLQEYLERLPEERRRTLHRLLRQAIAFRSKEKFRSAEATLSD